MPHRKPLRPAVQVSGRRDGPHGHLIGSRIAIATAHGIYLIKPDGTRLERIEPRSADDPFGAGFFRPGIVRLAWRPLPAA